MHRWLLTSAPMAFLEQRESAAVQDCDALSKTKNLSKKDSTTLEIHPAILSSLRMATSPVISDNV